MSTQPSYQAQAQYEADYRNYIKGLPKEEQQKALQKKRELAKKQKQNQLKVGQQKISTSFYYCKHMIFIVNRITVHLSALFLFDF